MSRTAFEIAADTDAKLREETQRRIKAETCAAEFFVALAAAVSGEAHWRGRAMEVIEKYTEYMK